MSVRNSIGEHLEILQHLILQINWRDFTRQQQGRLPHFYTILSSEHHGLLYLLQAPSMTKIKLELETCLCHSLFILFLKKTFNFRMVLCLQRSC